MRLRMKETTNAHAYPEYRSLGGPTTHTKVPIDVGSKGDDNEKDNIRTCLNIDYCGMNCSSF